MIPAGLPFLGKLIAHQLSAFPEHDSYLSRRFSELSCAEWNFAERIAEKVLQIAGGRLERICEDYRWLSGVMLDEELHFRRTGRYRLSRFEEAQAQVYSDLDLMTRYMNGVLASQLWWRNHTEMLHFFHDDFLGQNRKRFRHLEIGPGHGLFLSLAAASPNCLSAEAWDISDASLLNTRNALDAMHLGHEVLLKKASVFDAPKGQFNSIAFSEVLEHLERPSDALSVLRGLLAEDGRIFLNAPVNSPAPDHLYLFETPEQIVELVVDAGFAVESSRFSPCTGATLERARKWKLSISVGIILRKV